MTQVRRALKRLIGVKLVEVVEPGHGRVATVYRLRWRLPSFPQPFVPSFPEPLSQGKEKRAPKETPTRPKGAAGVKNLPIRRPPSALRWLMLQARKEISRWGLPPPRREGLLRAVGATAWRALKKGLVRTTKALRRFLGALLRRLREAPEGVSRSLRRAFSFLGWAAKRALEEVEESRRAEERAREMGETIRRWREEGEGGLERFLEEAGVNSLTEYIRRRLSVTEGRPAPVPDEG